MILVFYVLIAKSLMPKQYLLEPDEHKQQKPIEIQPQILFGCIILSVIYPVFK